MDDKEEKDIVQDSIKENNDGIKEQNEKVLTVRRDHSASDSSKAVSSDGESETVCERAYPDDPDQDWRYPPPEILPPPLPHASTEPPDSDSDQDKLVINLEGSPQRGGDTD